MHLRASCLLRATLLGQDRSKPCCTTLIIKYSWRSCRADSDNGLEHLQTRDAHCLSCPVCCEALHSISALVLFPDTVSGICLTPYISQCVMCAYTLCTCSQLPAVLTCLICLSQGLPCRCVWSSTSGYWALPQQVQNKDMDKVKVAIHWA